MKKLLLLLIAGVFVSATGRASDKFLQVWQADGQVVTINLSEEPVTTYSEGNLIITTTTTTIAYPLEQVSRYTYATEGVSEGDGVPDGINAIASNDGETLTFKNLKAGASVLVYSASGQLVRSLKPSGDKVAVSLSQLPTGVYLVKANGVTYKISKR